MTLSIIIPVYNLNLYLDRCLESVLTQTYRDIEVLLVDDGSHDGTAECCDKWQKQDKRIRVFHHSNCGVSIARNIGLEETTGSFITFVDGDDYIQPDMYKCLLYLQDKYQTDITICDFINETKDGVCVPNFQCSEVKTLSPQEQMKCLLTNTFFTCSCWGKIFLRKTVENIRFNPHISHLEDLLFCYYAMKNSNKAVFISEPFYHYCSNDGSSAARQPFGDKQMTMLDVWDFIHEDALNSYPQLIKIIQNQYLRNYIMCAMMAHRSNYISPRIKKFLRCNILHILMSSLSLGYKKQALLHCLINRIKKK